MDYAEFIKTLAKMSKWLKVKNVLARTSKKTKQDIFALHQEVSARGGWIAVIGSCSWPEISAKLEIEDARNLYETYFLHLLEPFSSQSVSADQVKSLQPDLLCQVDPVTTAAIDWEQVFAEDLSLIRGLVYGEWGFPTSMLTIDSLELLHGSVSVQMLHQDLSNKSFKTVTAYKQSATIADYAQIMRNPPKSEQIPFVTNIDIGDWPEEIDALRQCLPAEVLWCSDKDALRHSRQHYLGITTPQVYMKIEGCWTGGHEENLRLHAVNVNHGPNSCEWWGLDPAHALRFREKVLEEFGCDVYHDETLWWPDPYYCLANGFRLYHMVQQPGDLVLVGAGTMHWVRSLGVTVNSAWNFAPKTKKAFEHNFTREAINRRIGFRNIVPIHNVALDLLNEELEELPADLVQFLFHKLVHKLKKELKPVQGLMKEYGASDNVLFCEKCNTELLAIYHLCERCYHKRQADEDAYCFFCTQCIQKHRCKKRVLKYKFRPSDLKALKQRYERLVHTGVAGAPLHTLQWHGMDKDEAAGTYVSEFNGLDQLPLKRPASEQVDPALAKWRRLQEECKNAGKITVLLGLVPKKVLKEG